MADIDERTRHLHESIAKAMRENGHDEATIAEVVARTPVVIAWATGKMGPPLNVKGTSEPYTPEALDRVARRLAGKAGGRRPGITTITDDEQLRAPIREMRRDRVRITTSTIAARAGFTVSEVRGYLRVTGRTLAEFLNSF